MVSNYGKYATNHCVRASLGDTVKGPMIVSTFKVEKTNELKLCQKIRLYGNL